MNRSFALLAALLLLPAATAEAQSESDDGMASRHALELAIGGGLSTASLSPSRFDVQVGGQLNARAMVDLVHVRADASLIMPDPTRPEQLQLRGDARLLFVVAHDFTWRNSADGELLRVFGGLGGDIDLPGDFGHLMLSAGFAMHRFSPSNSDPGSLSESYGAYAGATLRLHFWEIRNDLRVAVHGMLNPRDFVPTLDIEGVLGQLQGGATVSNRLYIQAIREGVVSAGPELVVSYEGLLEGPVFYATLGISGTLGL